MFFNDPIEFEEHLAPVGGNVRIRPAIGSVFNAEIHMKKLDRIGLFAVTANSFRAVKEPREDIYGLTIPLSASFTVSDRVRNNEYVSSTGHMLASGRTFDLTAKRKAHFLVSIFFVKPVHEYSARILQSDSLGLSSIKPNVAFTHAGSNLLRSVARAWSAMNINVPASEVALKELEDDLLASLVVYASEETNDCVLTDGNWRSRLSQAEDYICDNLKTAITRDQLAEISGRSIRTLSRLFEKKYGIGPMAFTKQRRLDAAYLDLLRAEPDSTTVTQVAIDYGFAHIGKFAIEYAKAFGESPSASLTRV